MEVIDIVLLLTGIMLFCYWLNYAMGDPLGKEPDVRAILFFFPRHLSRRWLDWHNLEYEWNERLETELGMTQNPVTKRQLYLDNMRDRYLAGREFFGWERALLCPVCLHWWLTIMVVSVACIFHLLCIRDHIALVAFIYLVNHFFIRKI